MAVDRGTAAPLDSDWGEPRTTAADPAFLAAATATFLLLLLASEVASRVAARSGFWYRHVVLAGTVTSLPELRERIRWAAGQAHPAFILGDSVLGASALLEHGIPDARRRTLSAFLAGLEAREGRHVESLAADGMLVPDIEALTRLLRDTPPRRAMLLLNVRMFAAEFQDPRKRLSRDFLAPALPAAAGAPPRSWLEHRVPEWALEHSALLRTSSMLKALWYFPTRRDFFRRVAERVLGTDSDPEIQEAALRLKVASYYRDRWADSSAAFASLDRALRTLAASTRAVVVLTPQNPDFIDDAEALRSNRSLLEAFVRARGRSIEYQDWSERFAPDRFLDHCHLTAAGNREYAGDLVRLLEE